MADDTIHNLDTMHHLCCLPYRGKRLPIFGSFPSDERFDMFGTYSVFVKKGDYDELRKALKDVIEPEILSSVVATDNKMVCLNLPGGYCAYLANMKKPEKPKSSIPAVIEETRTTIPDRAKQFWRILGGKRRTAKLVPSGYRNIIYRRL